MSKRSVLCQTLVILSAVFPGCSGGGGGGPAGTRAPAGVQVFSNPLDDRLAAWVDERGNSVLFRGAKDSAGFALAATSVTVVPAGRDPVQVQFDGERRPHRVVFLDGSGLRADWRPDGLVRFRCFDPSGAILADAWMDRATGVEVPAPVPLSTTPPPVLGAVGGGQTDGSEGLGVAVRIVDCEGRESAGLAAMVESCQVELSSPYGAYSAPAVRQGGRFVVDLPRSLTPSEWTESHCQRLLDELAKPCGFFADPVASGLLAELCLLPAVAALPQAALICELSLFAVNIYCFFSESINAAICSAAAVVADPFVSIWTEPGERRLRARVVLRTCDGLEVLESATVTVTHAQAGATLSVEACQEEEPIRWFTDAAGDVVGGFILGSSQTPLQFDPMSPQNGLVPVAQPLPPLGPRVDATSCYWPPSFDPIYEVLIEKTVSFTVAAGPDGGGYSTSLDIARSQDELREPTPEEIQYGVPAGVEGYCLQSPQSVRVGSTSLYVVTLRPLQRLVVDMQLSGGGPDVSHRAELKLGWPLFGGQPLQRNVEGSGSASLNLTHDEVLAAYRAFSGQIPVPPGFGGIAGAVPP
ncbi:MAG TPA: hypothetical protein ENI87_09160, partial [bacterium]|nr:hypothetical protein [bacterium]